MSIHFLWFLALPAWIFCSWTIMQWVFFQFVEGDEWWRMPAYMAIELPLAVIGLGGLIVIFALGCGA